MRFYVVSWLLAAAAIFATLAASGRSVRAAGDDDDKKAADHKEITNSIKMKLVLVPAGEFKMGTSEPDDDLNKAFPDATKEDKEKFDDERPRHKVRITKDFYLGISNVTLAQFREFVND